MIDLEEIVREVSYRCKSGSPNWKNKEDISLLSEVLSEMGYGSIKHDLIKNLTEGPNDGDNARTSKQVKQDDAKQLNYVHKGNGIYVKASEKDKDLDKAGSKYTKDDNGNFKQISDAEVKKIMDKNGEEGGSNNNPEAKPNDGEVPADQNNAEEEELQKGIKRTFSDPEYQQKIKDEEDTISGNSDGIKLPPDGELYSVGNGYYSTRKDGPAEFKKVDESKTVKVVGGGTVTVDPVPPKQTEKHPEKNVLNKKKNKELSEINHAKLNVDIYPLDEDFDSMRLPQNSDTPTIISESIFGSPSKVPKKYKKLLERLINTRLINQTEPSMTNFIAASGAGLIQAQAGEVMSMIFTSLDEESFNELVSVIKKHNEKHEIKKKDGSSYAIPKYSKENQPILSNDWIDSAIAVRMGILQRYDYEYGKGNWEMEYGTWDLKEEVEALGLSDYANNKGFSTDMYIRIKDKNTGKSKLDEVTLKKNLDIFLSQPSVTAVYTWAFSNEEREEYETIVNRRSELKSSGESNRGDGKKEDVRLYTRLQELLNIGESRVPDEANPSKFNQKTTDSATKYYNSISLDQLNLIQSISDSPDNLKKLEKELSYSASEVKQFVKILKSLKSPLDREQIKQQMMNNGFSANKTHSKYIDKFIVMTMRTGKMMGDIESTNALEKHLQIGKNFNQSFVKNMMKEPFKTGMMNTVREKFPLKSLLEGEEKMSLGGIIADPLILKTIFGTTDYDEIEETLEVEGPDTDGLYQLTFATKSSGDKITLSTINPRQRGLGYETAVNLEMLLHEDMKQKLYCANISNGRTFPEQEKYSSKYKCE